MHQIEKWLRRPSMQVLMSVSLVITVLILAACQPIQPTGEGTVPQPIPTATSDPASQQALRMAAESTSPDGRWTASTIALFDTQNNRYYQRLVVRAVDGDPRYVLVDTWTEMALGYTIAVPLTWSQDSRRLYYTNRPTLDDCGLLTNGSDLWRVDVSSGEATQVLPPVTSVLGLAPDEEQVAYLKLGEPALVVRQLDGEEEQIIPLDEETDDGQLGAITWSPTGERLAFGVAYQPCSDGFAQSTSVYTVDIASLTATPQLLRDDRLLLPETWLDNQTLRLAGVEGDSLEIDVTTDVLSP